MTLRNKADAMLKTSISRFVTVGEPEFRQLSLLFRSLTLAKKQTWILPGCHCTEIIFVVKGCLRSYFSRNGVERTGQFFFEGSWYADYNSCRGKEATQLGIEALEPAELLVINFADLEQLYEQYPAFERLGRLMAEHTLMSMGNRTMSLLNDSPEQAYLKLCKERPMVISRVPQHIIASFLGIEPETLSRIRKKLSIRGEFVIS